MLIRRNSPVRSVCWGDKMVQKMMTDNWVKAKPKPVAKPKPIKRERRLDDIPYVYGVEISKVGDYKIITMQFNFKTKADALRWGFKQLKPKQYGTLIKYPNRYYYKAGYWTRESSNTTLAYERGKIEGTLRYYNGNPVVVDEDDYMYFISENYRLVKKTKSPWKDAHMVG